MNPCQRTSRVALGLLFASVAGLVEAEEIDFTRFLHRSSGDCSLEQEFHATPGPARLTIERSDESAQISITVNGEAVASGELALRAQNRVALSCDMPSDAQVTVRIKQVADVSLNVVSRVHFNTNDDLRLP